MNVIVWIKNSNPTTLDRALGVLRNLCDEVNLVGTIDDETPHGGGVKYLDKNDLAAVDFDLIVVNMLNVPIGHVLTEGNARAATFANVIKEATKLGIDTSKVVADRTVCLAGFTVEKYQRLVKSRLSILSTNCWGGVMYHAFGLPFLSPTINLFFPDGGFMKVLRDPKKYFETPLEFVTLNKNSRGQNYPVFMLRDAEVRMLHYIDADCINTARRKWEERLQKINWDNVLMKMSATTHEVLEEFDRLPFEKKVCSVPFETDLPSGYHIEFGKTPMKDRWRIALDVANPKHWRYNLWDMLLDGKKTPLE